MKCRIFILIIIHFAFVSIAQPPNCILKPPQYTIHFGKGNVRDPNSNLYNFRRVSSTCPRDGSYSFVSFTRGCFNDDWHTLTEDHTSGDVNGNMLLVNAAPNGGVFLNMPVIGLKPNTLYELGLWVINLCKPTKKCPFLLLPSLNIQVQNREGKIIGNIVTNELQRVVEPVWTQHTAFFKTSSAYSLIQLIMADQAPGGCGNDFALDDITFRECVEQPQPKTVTLKSKPVARQPIKKVKPGSRKKEQLQQPVTWEADTLVKKISAVKPAPKIVPSPPSVLKTRENALIKRMETEAGNIIVNIYDNGQIDGDTVSIYHNNRMIKSHQRLSQKPITITIPVSTTEPHHELIMVAENLGSIPPNTSVMIITTPGNRYSVFITSNEQKNAKVVFDLKK